MMTDARPKESHAVALLLGAGASRPLGLPMMADLLPSTFLDLLSGEERAVFDCAANWARAQLPGVLDFEFLFTAVNAIAEMKNDDLVALAFAPSHERRGLHYSSGPDRIEPDIAWARVHAGTLLTKLKVTVHDRLAEVDPVQAAALYIPLFELLSATIGKGRTIECFTTNYDRSIEAIWGSEQDDQEGLPFELNRGFRQANANRGTELDPGCYKLGTVDDAHGRTAINLVKLHGGLNWIREGQRVLESPTSDYVRRNTLLYPLRKATIEEPFASLLRLFVEALRAADTLVVVGSALRDLHIRSEIESAILARPGFRVVVVAPNAPEIIGTFDSAMQAGFIAVSGYFGKDDCLSDLRDRLAERGGQRLIAVHNDPVGHSDEIT